MRHAFPSLREKLKFLVPLLIWTSWITTNILYSRKPLSSKWSLSTRSSLIAQRSYPVLVKYPQPRSRLFQVGYNNSEFPRCIENGTPHSLYSTAPYVVLKQKNSETFFSYRNFIQHLRHDVRSVNPISVSAEKQLGGS